MALAAPYKPVPVARLAPPDAVVGNSGQGGQYATPATASTTPAPPPVQPQSAQDYYASLLQNDQLLKQTLAGLNASGVQNQAGLQAAQQRALIQHGGVPDPTLLAKYGVSGIDQTTRDLANQNTSAGLSTLAKLTQNYKLADQASVNSEAARGMLRSGEYGQHAAENLLGYNQAQDSATSQLLDYLNGIYSGYLGQQQTLQGQAGTAQQDATTRLFDEIKAGLVTHAPNVADLGVLPTGPGPVTSAFTADQNGNTGLTPATVAYLKTLPANAAAAPHRSASQALRLANA